MSKHRAISTGVHMDERGIFVVISESDEYREDRIFLSAAEASEMIPKLRLHIDEIMQKLKWYSPEDWK